MNPQPNSRPNSFSQQRLSALICTMTACLLIAGCRVYPEPNRKSINELYFEALAAQQNTPEGSLGANPPAHSFASPTPQTASLQPLDPLMPAPESQPVVQEHAAASEIPPEVPPVPVELLPPQTAVPPHIDAAPADGIVPSVEGQELTPESSTGQEPLIVPSARLHHGTAQFDQTAIAKSHRVQSVDTPHVRSAAAQIDQPARSDSGWKNRSMKSSLPRTSAAVGTPAEPSGPVRIPQRGAIQQTGAIEQSASTTGTPTSVTPGPAVISETFDDTDINQALQLLASQAGVSVIVDERVSGSVTTIIEEEDIETALRKILLPLGLVYRKSGPAEYIVASPDPESALFSRVSERREYRPLHLGPEELFKMLSPRDAKFVSVVDKRNLIRIEAPAEMADGILASLQQADQPIPQVELEAIVCVIAPDKGFKSGLDWSHAVTLNGNDVFRLGMTGLALSGSGSGSGANSAFTNFAITSTFVKLLAQEGYLTIRAAPRVTARDGEPAKIAITRQSFFSTQPNNPNAFFRQEVQEVEAGISLEITPIIRGDNITVKIEKAEVSEDIRTTDVNANIASNPYPLINRRSVATTVNVKDAETIVIGGLVQRQTVDRVARIPVLGDIPWAGRIFQTVEKTEQDAEVVIFISPRIVTSGPVCAPPPVSVQ